MLTECVPAAGSHTKGGYVAVYLPSEKRQKLAHRLAWEIAHGPIPAGLFVCHRCDNPPCVRPDHLFLGTALDNAADCVSKGRHVYGERHPKSRLSALDVVAIRAKYRRGIYGTIRLASEFGVHRKVIFDIVHGKIWKSQYEKISE